MSNEFHDRLDKKLTVEEYTDAPCGSLNLRTGKPEYCDFNCPTLREKLAKGEEA